MIPKDQSQGTPLSRNEMKELVGGLRPAYVTYLCGGSYECLPYSDPPPSGCIFVNEGCD